MINCISVENIRRSDAYTITNFVPSLELMYRAALGVFKAATWTDPIAIVAGSGNNGGDGYALACILKTHGLNCTVFSVGSHLSDESAYYADNAQKLGIEVFPYQKGSLDHFKTIVDCLLGTGFRGTVRPDYLLAIEEINALDAFVVSVDINSGMNGDTGDAEIAVHSDLTVTIGYVKTGLISQNAGKFMKRLVCADIGIILEKEEFKICSQEEELSSDCYYRCPHWLDMKTIDVK